MTGINEELKVIIEGENLGYQRARNLLDTIFTGEVEPEIISAILTALASREVRAEELAGFTSSLREHSIKVKTGLDRVVDTCGTGGAKIKTANISTAAAIIAAGAGVHVAKHGNRAVTSKCGSADVLEKLGVKIDASPEIIAECIREANIGFMFAPNFHPAMKYVQPIRKTLKIRTVFNILGPLANPAQADSQILGVPEENLAMKMVEVLNLLKTRYAMVVHSNGMDEISNIGTTKIKQLKDGEITEKEISPEQFGIKPVKIEDIRVNSVEDSAKVLMDIIINKEKSPRRDIVVMNAAGAIIAGGITDDFEEGIRLAKESIENGKTHQSLKKLIEISNK